MARSGNMSRNPRQVAQDSGACQVSFLGFQLAPGRVLMSSLNRYAAVILILAGSKSAMSTTVPVYVSTAVDNLTPDSGTYCHGAWSNTPSGSSAGGSGSAVALTLHGISGPTRGLQMPFQTMTRGSRQPLAHMAARQCRAASLA